MACCSPRRGHRVVPTVETMLELREQKLYEHALPDLGDELNWLRAPCRLPA